VYYVKHIERVIDLLSVLLTNIIKRTI